MTCRHRNPTDNPDCSSYIPMERREAKMRTQLTAEIKKRFEDETPNPGNYDVIEMQEVGTHLVAKVAYPNCIKCAFEGTKVMVFLNTSLRQAIRWRQIDPHFREEASNERAAPSPAARFPASADGWQDALAYAWSKSDVTLPEAIHPTLQLRNA